MACWTSTDVEVIYSLSISRDNEDCGNINATPDKELTTNLEMSVPEKLVTGPNGIMVAQTFCDIFFMKKRHQISIYKQFSD